MQHAGHLGATLIRVQPVPRLGEANEVGDGVPQWQPHAVGYNRGKPRDPVPRALQQRRPDVQRYDVAAPGDELLRRYTGPGLHIQHSPTGKRLELLEDRRGVRRPPFVVCVDDRIERHHWCVILPAGP